MDNKSILTVGALALSISLGPITARAYGEEPDVQQAVVPESTEYRTNFDVVMYSTTTCGYCVRARNWFEEHDIDFVEYFIDEDDAAARRYERLGMQVTPTIIVGDRVLKGYRPALLEELIFEQLVFD